VPNHIDAFAGLDEIIELTLGTLGKVADQRIGRTVVTIVAHIQEAGQ